MGRRLGECNYSGFLRCPLDLVCLADLEEQGKAGCTSTPSDHILYSHAPDADA